MKTVFLWAAACTLTVLGASAAVPEAARLLPGEYVDDGMKTERPLPAAWGIHFRKGETWKWKCAWLHIAAEA